MNFWELIMPQQRVDSSGWKEHRQYPLFGRLPSKKEVTVVSKHREGKSIMQGWDTIGQLCIRCLLPSESKFGRRNKSIRGVSHSFSGSSRNGYGSKLDQTMDREGFSPSTCQGSDFFPHWSKWNLEKRTNWGNVRALASSLWFCS